MKLGFMSSVCPKMSLSELISTATTYGYAGIEFRVQWDHGHGVELETPKAELKQKRKQLADSGIEASCLATGDRFCDDEADKRNACNDELLKMIDLAATMGIPRLRIFGDPLPEDPSVRAQNRARQRDHLAPLAEAAKNAGVTLCLETHGNMTGTDVADVIAPVNSPALRALWHPLHPCREKEALEITWSKISEYVDHCHMSVDEHATAQRNHEYFNLLNHNNFNGYQSVEIIDPPDSIAVIKEYADHYKQFSG